MKVRRQDRLLDVERAYELLAEGEVGYLALTDGDKPYVVPLNYYTEAGVIYFHCAQTGRKLDILSKNPRFCFAVSAMDGIISGPLACNYGTSYRSVMAFGRARMVTEPEEKVRVLERLTARYAPPGAVYEPVTDDRADQTAVVALDIEEMTAKCRG